MKTPTPTPVGCKPLNTIRNQTADAACITCPNYAASDATSNPNATPYKATDEVADAISQHLH
jgi:hypothetical protein